MSPPAKKQRPRAGGGSGGPRPDRDAGVATRRRALDVLLEVERGALATERLRGDDERFVRELVLGVIRRQLTLDVIGEAFGSRPTAELDAEVRAAIRLGLYQHLFLDGVPPHALVAATVGAVTGSLSGKRGGRGYVNAVLRTVLRESHKVPEAEDRGGASPTKRLPRPGRTVTFFSRPVLPDPERDRLGWLAALHSHPRFLVERWVQRVGEAAAVARMEGANQHPRLMLRPRRGRIDAAGLAEHLAREGLAVELLPGGTALAVQTEKGRSAGVQQVLETRAFRDGLCTIQDVAQQFAAETLAPRRGEYLWDACAAPGGKTAQLAERLEAAGGGVLVATDRSAVRLERVHETIVRLGLQGVQVHIHDLLGAQAPAGRPARGFDAILLDAPCSNTAVLGRRPEARWRLRPETFGQLGALQRRLLGAVEAQLAPEGRLVYSTCSHEPEEGEEHGLQATSSPLVFTATAHRLAERVAAWRASGALVPAGTPAQEASLASDWEDAT